MSVKVKIDTKQFEKETKMFLKRKEAAIRLALDAVAQEIRNDANLLVPVDTGILRVSIHVENPGSTKMYRKVGSKMPYARYIEQGKPEGTGPHGGPRPYLTPAFEKGKKAFPDILRKAYKLK